MQTRDSLPNLSVWLLNLPLGACIIKKHNIESHTLLGQSLHSWMSELLLSKYNQNITVEERVSHKTRDPTSCVISYYLCFVSQTRRVMQCRHETQILELGGFSPDSNDLGVSGGAHFLLDSL